MGRCVHHTYSMETECRCRIGGYALSRKKKKTTWGISDSAILYKQCSGELIKRLIYGFLYSGYSGGHGGHQRGVILFITSLLNHHTHHLPLPLHIEVLGLNSNSGPYSLVPDPNVRKHYRILYNCYVRWYYYYYDAIISLFHRSQNKSTNTNVKKWVQSTKDAD